MPVAVEAFAVAGIVVAEYTASVDNAAAVVNVDGAELAYLVVALSDPPINGVSVFFCRWRCVCNWDCGVVTCVSIVNSKLESSSLSMAFKKKLFWVDMNKWQYKIQVLDILS